METAHLWRPFMYVGARLRSDGATPSGNGALLTGMTPIGPVTASLLAGVGVPLAGDEASLSNVGAPSAQGFHFRRTSVEQPILLVGGASLACERRPSMWFQSPYDQLQCNRPG